mgnify:CR=1 FL=1
MSLHYRQNMTWCAFIHLTLNWAINPTNLYPTTHRHSIIPKFLVTIKSTHIPCTEYRFFKFCDLFCSQVTTRGSSWSKHRANCGQNLQESKLMSENWLDLWNLLLTLCKGQSLNNCIKSPIKWPSNLHLRGGGEGGGDCCSISMPLLFLKLFQ